MIGPRTQVRRLDDVFGVVGAVAATVLLVGAVGMLVGRRSGVRVRLPMVSAIPGLVMLPPGALLFIV